MTDRATRGSITLRYFDGCPNWKVALTRLEDALEQVDRVTEVQLERVETADDAERLRFTGSPTILIDGTDPFAGKDKEATVGLSCRVYMTEAGTEGSPSVDQLVAVLNRG